MSGLLYIREKSVTTEWFTALDLELNVAIIYLYFLLKQHSSLCKFDYVPKLNNIFEQMHFHTCENKPQQSVALLGFYCKLIWPRLLREAKSFSISSRVKWFCTVLTWDEQSCELTWGGGREGHTCPLLHPGLLYLTLLKNSPNNSPGVEGIPWNQFICMNLYTVFLLILKPVWKGCNFA